MTTRELERALSEAEDKSNIDIPSFLRLLTFSNMTLIPLAWKPAHEAYNEASCDPLGLFVNFPQLFSIASIL